MRSFASLFLAILVGVLLGTVGHGSGPAPIETLDPGMRQPTLDLLMLLVVIAGFVAARAVGRYWKAGDPKPSQIYFVDGRTGQHWRGDAPRPKVHTNEAYTGDTERL